MGIGIVSGSVAVRTRVPWIKEDVGAIATQGYTRTRYGRKGLVLLSRGLNPHSTLQKLLQRDPAPEKRQIVILTPTGDRAVHDGSSCPGGRDLESRKNCVAIGNLLENEATVGEMAGAFEETDGPLSKRILEALKAGAEFGGDRRGNRTAALVVRGRESLDIGIIESKEPLTELELKYQKARSS